MNNQLSAFEAFESVPEALLIVGHDGLIVFGNQHAMNIFGYERGEFIGLDVDALVPEGSRHLHAELRAKFAGDPSCRPMGGERELRAVRSDGRSFPVEIGIGPTHGGQHVAVLVRDISAVTEIRSSLHVTEVEVRSLAEALRQLPIGFCHFDKELRFVRISEWLAEINGVSVEEHLGRKIGDVIPNIATLIEPILKRVLQTGEPVINGAVTGTTPAHPTTERTYMHNYSPDMSADGTVVGVICVVHDVTDATTNLEDALKEVERLKNRLQAEAEYLREDLNREFHFDEIVGKSDAMMVTLQKVKQVAKTDATVLLLGETGTGKELLAHAIHAQSNRRRRPLIKIDCTTLPPSLVESELFGHEKGAFTGAHQMRPGRFELADGGTIFLDEIGELSLDLQAKLLTVLQDGEFARLGSKTRMKVDVRIIAATNRDLKLAIHEGRFRSDLYYRINVFPLESPPLRDRREDIPLLAAYFLTKFRSTIGKSIDTIAKSSIKALEAYDWPGNVRELQNVIERSAILCEGDTLNVREMLGEASDRGREPANSLRKALKEVERVNILNALEESGWKVKGRGNAASRLGLNPSTLRSRMQRLGISRP